MKTAILGTDLSAASDRIIDNSNQFKLLGIKKIILVYVLNLRSIEEFSDYSLDSTQIKIDSQRDRLLSFGFEAESRIVMGVPANEIMRQVKINNAELVIVGSRGNSWSKSTLGETASEVLHNIKCPVLLIAFENVPNDKQPDEPKPADLHRFEKYLRQFRKQVPKIDLLHKTINQHVLLTTDFSDFSENAFQFMKDPLAPVPMLTLMHIQDANRITKHLEDKLEEFNMIDTKRLQALQEEFTRVHPETEFKIVLEHGNPKQLITDYIKASQVTLTVMGSQGHGYIGEFFLGSVSLRVARQAESNVLIIPFHKKL